MKILSLTLFTHITTPRFLFPQLFFIPQICACAELLLPQHQQEKAALAKEMELDGRKHEVCIRAVHDLNLGLQPKVYNNTTIIVCNIHPPFRDVYIFRYLRPKRVRNMRDGKELKVTR